MLKAELVRFKAEFLLYRQTHLGKLLTLLLMTGGLFFLISLLGEASVARLAALFFWQYATVPLSRLTLDIWEETSSGAFDQMYLHTSQPALVLLTRMGVHTLQQTVLAVPLFLGLALLFGIPASELAQYPWAELFGVLVLTVVGLAGFGLIIGAVSLVYYDAVSYADAAEYVLLFLSGAVVPIAQLPGPLGAISPWLPLSLGIEAVRRLEVGADWQGIALLLVIQSAVLVAIGIVVFRACLERGRRRGFGMGA